RHSQANTVRVMLSGDAHNCYRILIEDDGVGIEQTETAVHRDEHFGLQILRERAKRIGGDLSIESESGEGTRVVLSFNYPQSEATGSLRVDLSHTDYEVARSNH
ncbi:MAG: hypothetical protein OET44_09260, partial [Gammaproteobacteria bacterium]|nr:hypothetical protein [Gammaproteobacteria bacterium]